MVLDLIVLIIAIYGFYLGYSRGIIKTVFYVISLLFGFIAAVKFAPSTTQLLTDIFNYKSPLMYLAGFLLCLVVTILLIRMFAKFLEGVLKTAHINFVNKFFGGILLGSFLMLLLSQVFWLGEQANLITAENSADSKSYPYLRQMPDEAKKIADLLQPSFESFWEQSLEFIDELEEMSKKNKKSSD